MYFWNLKIRQPQNLAGIHSVLYEVMKKVAAVQIFLNEKSLENIVTAKEYVN